MVILSAHIYGLEVYPQNIYFFFNLISVPIPISQTRKPPFYICIYVGNVFARHKHIYIIFMEGDESKVGLLKSFPGAEERLHLFEADIYKPQEFEKAIQGCIFVFHVATPLFHTNGYKYNDVVEATIGAAKTIANACINSGTVKRLIYTSSVVAASPLKYDGSGYKITIDESCWTPLHLSVPFAGDSVQVNFFSIEKNQYSLIYFLITKFF
ncbi:putative (3R)-2'-hydroxyisoflavanone reductase [Helianthus anomalus]